MYMEPENPALINELQNIIKLGEEPGRSTDWNRIRIIVSEVCHYERPFRLHMFDFWQMVIDLTFVFETKNCPSTIFIAQLLETAYNVTIEEIEIAKTLLKEIEDSVSNETGSQSTIEFMKLFQLPYNVAHEHVDSSKDALTRLSMTGDIGMLELLLRFGAIPLQPRDDQCNWKQCISIVRKLFSDITSIPDEHFEESLIQKFNPSSRKRLFFVMRCLNVVPKLLIGARRESPSYSYIDCQEVLFRAIPEPLITRQEIIRGLSKLLDGFKDYREIRRVAKQYETCFETERKQLSCPRSLIHLSRCQVRENMRRSSSAFRLPFATRALNIPEKIKDYILLRETPIPNLPPDKLTSSRLPHYFYIKRYNY